jgi:dTDP-L-rhamnose 4-epimerase
MNILVTGGAGFIGSHLVDKLVESNHNITIFDNLSEQVHKKIPSYLNKKANFIKGDLLDYNHLKNTLKNIDVVFHLASRVGVGQSMYEIKKYIENNELGTANLLDILSKQRIKKLILASSSSIYGEGNYICKKCNSKHNDLKRNLKDLEQKKWNLLCPVCKNELEPIATREDSKKNCESFYSISKKNQEDQVLSFSKFYNVPATILRFSNVYGPRQSLNNPYTGIAAIFISRLKNNNSPVIFEDGNQLRNFVSVHDIVKGLILTIDNEQSNGKIMNLGSNEIVSVNKIANTLIEQINPNIKPLIKNQYRAGDIRHCFADISNAKRILNYESEISFNDGMSELIIWQNSQESNDKFDDSLKDLIIF